MSIVKRALGSALDVWIAERRSGTGLARIAQHHVVAEAVIPCFRELLIDADRLGILSRVMNASEPPAVGLSDGPENRTSLVGSRCGGNRAPDQALRVVHEHARRSPRRKSDDSTAARVGGCRSHASELHCFCIREQGVPVDAREDYRIVRKCERQGFVRSKFLDRPAVLVPATSLNPFARLHISRTGFDASDDFAVGSR